MGVARKIKLPEVGQDAAVWWIDSGASSEGESGSPKEGLIVRRTLGRVTYIGPDPTIHGKFCKKRCRCTVLELAMCSGGEKDTHSELGLIWVTSVVKVKVFRGRKKKKKR